MTFNRCRSTLSHPSIKSDLEDLQPNDLVSPSAVRLYHLSLALEGGFEPLRLGSKFVPGSSYHWRDQDENARMAPLWLATPVNRLTV